MTTEEMTGVQAARRLGVSLRTLLMLSERGYLVVRKVSHPMEQRTVYGWGVMGSCTHSYYHTPVDYYCSVQEVEALAGRIVEVVGVESGKNYERARTVVDKWIELVHGG